MKDKSIVSNDLINDIFYKIPEIHIHHTVILFSPTSMIPTIGSDQNFIGISIKRRNPIGFRVVIRHSDPITGIRPDRVVRFDRSPLL